MGEKSSGYSVGVAVGLAAVFAMQPQAAGQLSGGRVEGERLGRAGVGCEPIQEGQADCNANHLPDECEIENCDGRLSCSDCNGNGVPDGCELFAATIDKFADFGLVPQDIAEMVEDYPDGFYVPDSREPSLWRVEPDGSSASAFGHGLFTPVGALFVPEEFGGAGWRLFVANQNDPQQPNRPDIVIVHPDESVSLFADSELVGNGTGMTGLAYLPLAAGGPNAGRLLASSQANANGTALTGSLHAYDAAGGRTTLVSTFGSQVFSLAVAPPDFGALAYQVFIGDGPSGTLFRFDPQSNTLSVFTTIPLADGQRGTRQIAFSPVGWFGFLDPQFEDRSLMVVSISGSQQGLGSNGALAVLNAHGQVVARYTQETIGQIFDPRGLHFVDNLLLISNTASGNGGLVRLSVLDFTQGDCDGNEVLDACDLDSCPPGDVGCRDCQGNGFPDRCDVESGISEDANGNGVPDECDALEVACDAGGPYVATCGGGSATVALVGSASSSLLDTDLVFEWTTDCPSAEFDDAFQPRPVLAIEELDGEIACSAQLHVSGDGAVASCSASIEVHDGLPPVVETRNRLLWPPDRMYRCLTLSDCVVTAEDSCSGAIDVDAAGRILSIYSDEPKTGKDEGGHATCNDIIIDDSSHFRLRAERQGSSRCPPYRHGNGRVYGVAFEVPDPSGNTTTALCKFFVPYDEYTWPPIDDGPESGYTVFP